MTRFVLARPVHTRYVPRSKFITPVLELPNVCQRYRTALRWAGVACPAEVLWMPAAATWVREKGIAVEAQSSAELSLALSVGIAPSRITMHCVGSQAGTIRCGVNARVGQFVVDSNWQVGVLAHYVRGRRRVLVDTTAARGDDPADAVLGADFLDLVGLHRHVAASDTYLDAVATLIGQMAHLRSERGTLLTRLSLSGAVSASPQRVGADIADALDDACARFRFPRPGVTMALVWPIVRPW